MSEFESMTKASAAYRSERISAQCEVVAQCDCGYGNVCVVDGEIVPCAKCGADDSREMRALERIAGVE